MFHHQLLVYCKSWDNEYLIVISKAQVKEDVSCSHRPVFRCYNVNNLEKKMKNDFVKRIPIWVSHNLHWNKTYRLMRNVYFNKFLNSSQRQLFKNVYLKWLFSYCLFSCWMRTICRFIFGKCSPVIPIDVDSTVLSDLEGEISNKTLSTCNTFV